MAQQSCKSLYRSVKMDVIVSLVWVPEWGGGGGYLHILLISMLIQYKNFAAKKIILKSICRRLVSLIIITWKWQTAEQDNTFQNWASVTSRLNKGKRILLTLKISKIFDSSLNHSSSSLKCQKYVTFPIFKLLLIID